MPVNLRGYPNRWPDGRPKDNEFDYSYPNDLDLTPGSDTHERLKDMITDRAFESYQVMQNRHSIWEKINQNLTAYVPLDDAEQTIKNNDDRKPVRIIIPRTYSILETLLTYQTSAFGSRPYFKYEGVDGTDVLGAMLLELRIDYQMQKTKALLQRHTAWRDSYICGFGALHLGWETKSHGFKKKKKTRPTGGFLEALQGAFGGNGGFDDEVEVPYYEGNALRAIDPFYYIPDVNVPIHEVQRGEYTGWLDQTNYVSLLTDEKENPDTYFNVRYLRGISDGLSNVFTNTRYYANTGRIDKYSRAVPSNMFSEPIDVIRMYINLIPSEWELGDSDYPEKWMFSLAADEVIIQAEPIGFEHNMFPIAVTAPDYDGHTSSPIGRLEVTWGMQEAIDFLMSSHIANIRKSVNNMFVIDPSVVNINDFKQSKAGLLARIRQRYWGKPNAVKDAVVQLPVTDVTRANIGDIAFLSDAMKDSTSATDSLAGMFRKGGERVTATETRGTRSSALSRLERAALIGAIMCDQDIAHMAASNTIQLTEGSYYVRVHGRNQQELTRLLEVSPDDRVQVDPAAIDVNYDILSDDGSIDSALDTQSLIQALQIASTNPEIQATLDIPKIFLTIAKSSGVKNIEQFIRNQPIQPVVQDDQNVQAQAQQGNIVPVESL
jgi:hypothetical protein